MRPVDLIRRTQQSLKALYEAGGPIDDLTLPQFCVLDCLKRHGPQTATALVTLTGVDRTTLFQMVDMLRKTGLLAAVQIESSKPGRNPLAVSLTPKGMRLLGRADSAVWNAEVKLMSTLTPHERSTFLNVLAVTAFSGPRR